MMLLTTVWKKKKLALPEKRLIHVFHISIEFIIVVLKAWKIMSFPVIFLWANLGIITIRQKIRVF